jgi:acylphosphatase
MIRYKITVRGKVQGVGFRYFVLQEANLFNIKGYVKNLANGDVLIDAEGEEEVLEIFLTEIAKGSEYSAVSTVIKEEVAICNYNNFKIKY